MGRDFFWRIKFPAFYSIRSKVVDQKLVGITNNVLPFQHRRAQIQFFITESINKFLSRVFCPLRLPDCWNWNQCCGISGAVFRKVYQVWPLQCFPILVDQFSILGSFLLLYSYRSQYEESTTKRSLCIALPLFLYHHCTYLGIHSIYPSTHLTCLMKSMVST